MARMFVPETSGFVAMRNFEERTNRTKGKGLGLSLKPRTHQDLQKPRSFASGSAPTTSIQEVRDRPRGQATCAGGGGHRPQALRSGKAAARRSPYFAWE